MQSPVWILNSSLAILFIINLGFILFSQVSIPKRFKIEPTASVQNINRKEPSKVDCTRIHTDDLFATSAPKIEVPQEEEKNKILQIPEPPSPKSMPYLEEPKPQFLEPLPLKLKGVIVSTQDRVSQAIIANTKSGKEELFSNGDKIEDAYILRILPNKVILIRSNGQQESLFITTADAQTEIVNLKGSSWSSIVNVISENEFIVDPESFISQITNLAQFIDVLDLATVFKRGKSLGCRIGRISSNSIGDSLGLKAGDIITKINGVEPTDTNNRIEIYNKIKTLRIGDKILVDVYRNGKIITIKYFLQLIEPKPISEIEIPETERDIKNLEATENLNKAEEIKSELEPSFEDMRSQIEDQQMAFKKISKDVQKLDKQAMIDSTKYKRPGKGVLLKHMQG